MATRAQIDRARALRAEGKPYEDIAAALNAPRSTVYGWINFRPASYERECEQCGESFVAKYALARFCPEPKRCRKQHFEQANRATCGRCGGDMGQDSTRTARGDVCAGCRSLHRVDRSLEMVRLRREEGLNNTAIAARLGTTPAAVASVLTDLRALGIDVPYAKRRGGSQKATVVTSRALSLGRALERAGHTVPALSEAA